VRRHPAQLERKRKRVWETLEDKRRKGKTRDGPRTHLEGVAAAAAAEHDGRPAGDLAEDVVVIRGRGVEAALCHKGLGLNVRERRTDLSGRRRDVKKKGGKEE